MTEPERGDIKGGLGRRELIGQGLLLGALFLTGCGRRNTAAARPPLPGGNLPVLSTYTPPAVPTPAPVAAPGLVIMPRSAWTRSGPARTDPKFYIDLTGVSHVTVHHDGMPPVALRGRPEAAKRIESIRASHVNRGWADIGYHYVIDPTGAVWEARSSLKQGAHAQDRNEHNLGVLVLGNFDVQRPTPQALASLDQFIGVLMQRHGVPISRVHTHKEIGKTACPGLNLQRYMEQTRGSGGRLAMAAARGFRA